MGVSFDPRSAVRLARAARLVEQTDRRGLNLTPPAFVAGGGESRPIWVVRVTGPVEKDPTSGPPNPYRDLYPAIGRRLTFTPPPDLGVPPTSRVSWADDPDVIACWAVPVGGGSLAQGDEGIAILSGATEPTTTQPGKPIFALLVSAGSGSVVGRLSGYVSSAEISYTPFVTYEHTVLTASQIPAGPQLLTVQYNSYIRPFVFATSPGGYFDGYVNYTAAIQWSIPTSDASKITLITTGNKDGLVTYPYQPVQPVCVGSVLWNHIITPDQVVGEYTVVGVNHLRNYVLPGAGGGVMKAVIHTPFNVKVRWLLYRDTNNTNLLSYSDIIWSRPQVGATLEPVGGLTTYNI